jgi:hypothetical protein
MKSCSHMHPFQKSCIIFFIDISSKCCWIDLMIDSVNLKIRNDLVKYDKLFKILTEQLKD